MQVTQSSSEKYASTVDKSINQDNTQHMIKGVIKAARLNTLKWYAEGPGADW